MVGLIEGYITEKFSRRAYRSGGLFAWVPIVFLIVIGIARDARGPAAAFRELLTWSPYSIRGGAMELLTMPTWATCWYSIGVALRRHTDRLSAG